MNVQPAKATVVEAAAQIKADPRYTKATAAIKEYGVPAAKAVGYSAGIGACVGLVIGTATAVAGIFS